MDACHLFHSWVGRRLEGNHLNKTQNRGSSFSDSRAFQMLSIDALGMSFYRRSKQTSERKNSSPLLEGLGQSAPEENEQSPPEMELWKDNYKWRPSNFERALNFSAF